MFEFTTEILLRLGAEATSNRYGTFLCDCERERLQAVSAHTLSLWAVLLREKDTWRNPNYQRTEKVLLLNVSQACFNIWEGYWFRYHPRAMKMRLPQADSRGRMETAFDAQASMAAAPDSASGDSGKRHSLN